ncbi:Rieske 2Fe-2S domain-containing protein [Kordiimonas marina]|uniref:Rieske 2Fe-2S domain-containing protein n=1 Tax=Kordiimonas marina TaxID=2872312 RepID=UPI001FF4BE22|nr:Rieske 2Fe-2S domain-containing protein [Kordiimonas marina]MCJ9430412.1 Rieske 2Fe-2S domain-containing protein [Kordiimonas marina]
MQKATIRAVRAAEEEGRAWLRLGDAAALTDTGRAVFKIKGHQIAVFETPAGLYAINNRCPHEGYPLVEGSLKGDCILACNWHGWTFDLKDGHTLQGRDPVKTYPVERRDGALWVDLAPEPAGTLKARAYAELDEAMREHDYERLARALCRLDKAGEAYESVAVKVINDSLGQLERGLTHAQAGLADWTALAGDDPDLRLVAFLEALGHLSWDGLMSREAPVCDAVAPYSADDLKAAIEDMDQDSALALVRGAFRTGKGFADLKPVFLGVIFSHYAGFGHPAIYIMKIEELIARLGPGVEETLALQTARYMCQAAREDLIPEFRPFGDYLTAKPGDEPVPSAARFSGQSVRSALAMASSSLARPLELWEHLLAAGALNMLRFDITRQDRVEQPIAQNIGWLDFTHTLTFAEAVRFHARENPAYWRSGLLQMACFVGRNAAFLGGDDWGEWRVADRGHFFAIQKAALFNMDEGDYIFGVHRLKMVRAGEALCAVVGEDTASLIAAALNRYLGSPLRKRHPARAAFQARQTVLKEG